MCLGLPCDKCIAEYAPMSYLAHLLPGPAVGSRWRRKQDGAEVVVDYIGPTYVRCRQPDKPTHVVECTLRRWADLYEPASGMRDFATVEQVLAGGCNQKPPLGVVPRAIHDERRANALDEAIVRYLNEDLPVPLEWVEEFNELRTRLNK